jgi:hypothetical protein
MTDEGFGELAVAAAHLDLARKCFERALAAGVAEDEADKASWRLVLGTIRTARQFAIDCAAQKGGGT